jgi:hypothetical protein
LLCLAVESTQRPPRREPEISPRPHDVRIQIGHHMLDRLKRTSRRLAETFSDMAPGATAQIEPQFTLLLSNVIAKEVKPLFLDVHHTGLLGVKTQPETTEKRP